MEAINKLYYIFNRKQKIRFIELCFIMFVGSLLELAGVASIMPFVEVITKPEVIETNSLYRKIAEITHISEPGQFAVLIALTLIFIYILKNVYLVFMNYCQYRFTYNSQRQIAMKMMDCYMNQTYLFHISKNVSELQRNMQTDVDMMITAILAFIQLISEGGICLLIGLYLLVLDKSISIGLVLVLAMFSIVFFEFTKKKSYNLGEIKRNNSVQMNKWIRQSFEGIKEIKVYDIEDYCMKNVDEAYDILNKSTIKSNIINVLPRPIFESICISTMLIVVSMKILKGVNLDYFIPVIAAFAVAAARLLPSFGRLAGYVNQIVYNRPAIDNVYHDLREVEELQKKSKCELKQKKQIYLDKQIDIEGISFKYPNTEEKMIFDDATISIKKNTSIGIIGASGMGKSTFADIFMGLMEPESGKVLVDGYSIFDNLSSWHNIIGYIPQNIYLIDDSIKRNIAFGVPDEEVDEHRLLKAIEDAQLNDFIFELENGVDTVIGERGIRISGGQRQRVGIARALYQEPQVIVLDEATSALDTSTEKAVMESIEGLRKGRTLIIIAHRLTTIQSCDEIYEIENGKIINRDKNSVLNNNV